MSRIRDATIASGERMLRFLGSGDIKVAVQQYFERRPDLDGLRIVDVPAGSGALSGFLLSRGAKVEALDLFPDLCRTEGVVCRRADLRESLPLTDGRSDLVLFQEAIEHLEDPLHALRELNRVLTPGGTLLLTTPNASSLRARLSHLLVESELYHRLPPNELDAVWFGDGRDVYFGHLFLIGVQRLRVLARLAGFRLVRLHPVKVSVTSLLLGLLLPLLVPVNLYAWWRSSRRARDVPRETRRRVFGQIVRLNLHPAVLFGKHLFVEFEKAGPPGELDLPSRKDPSTIG